MTLFAPITNAAANLSLIDLSAPVPEPSTGPAPRFGGDPVRWVAAGNSANICAFARCSVRVYTGASDGIPGNPTAPWTLVELAPLPGFSAKALLALNGGLPVQYVLLAVTATTTAPDNTVAPVSQTVATAGPGAPSVWFGVCFQDRIVRDPMLWTVQIGAALIAAGAVATDWNTFATTIAALSPAKPIYILDHIGRPFRPDTAQTVSITTSAGTTSVTFDANSDGNSGVALPGAEQATISFTSAAHPVIAGAEVRGGAFEGSYQLAPGERHAQLADAESWLAPRDNPGVTQLARWNPNSFLEPIVDGNPYFARLVTDLRSTKNGGGAGLAGWAFVKESLLDKTLPWPLVPGQNDTELVPLITELATHGSQVRMLVNQFLQFEGGSFDDGTAALALLWALFAATFPLAAFSVMTTDPAGFGVLLGCIAVAEFLIATPLTLDVLKAIAEVSTSTVNDLTPVSPDLIRWSPYPATTSDNPFYTGSLKLADITIDDIIHFGVYHQKFVIGMIPTTPQPQYFGYLGGIDINSDRVDSPLHRALFPFHDVQARLTGPVVKDLIQSFAERSAFDHGTPPFAVPSAPPQLDPPGSHLVQIGRTYFKPKSGPGFPFAPNGETVTHRTNLAAIKAARDFIYIEEQYFTPNDEYVAALMDAASKAERLIITVCMQNGQTFGPIRRTDVLAQLATVWGTRMKVGAPIRRFLNPTPAKTVNLGRCVLLEAISGSSPTITVGPTAHIPDPPFWAFVDNELMQVTASQPATDPGQLVLYVNRGPTGTITNWGAKVDKHDENSAVMCVRVPHIYVHAKLMIIDDVFLSVGSANLNRRGHFHDGEINALTIPQHLKRDPANPARVLRCTLWAEHMGLTPEMGLSLLADPLSALPYFDRPWFAGNRWQPLAWAGVETDTQLGFSSSDSIAMEFLNLAVGAGEDAYKPTLWPLLVDPTCLSDPNSDKPGPEYPS